MPARFAWIRQSDGETLFRPKWDARTFSSNGPSPNIPWSAVATKDLGPNWERSANHVADMSGSILVTAAGLVRYGLSGVAAEIQRGADDHQRQSRPADRPLPGSTGHRKHGRKTDEEKTGKEDATTRKTGRGVFAYASQSQTE